MVEPSTGESADSIGIPLPVARITHDGCGGEVHALYIRVNGANGRRTWMRFGTACVGCHTLSPLRDSSGAAFGIGELKEYAQARLNASDDPSGADG